MSKQIDGIGKEFDRHNAGFTGTDISTVNPVLRFVAGFFGFTFRYGDQTILLDAKTRASAKKFLDDNYSRAGSGASVVTMLNSFLSEQLGKQLLTAQKVELSVPLFRQALYSVGIQKQDKIEFVEKELGSAQNGKITATHSELIQALKPYESDVVINNYYYKNIAEEMRKQLASEPVRVIKQVPAPPRAQPRVIPEAERQASIQTAHAALVQAYQNLGQILRADNTIRDSLSGTTGWLGRYLGWAEYKDLTDILDTDISRLSVNDLLKLNHELEALVKRAYSQTKYQPSREVRESFAIYNRAYDVWWHANAAKVPPEVQEKVSDPQALEAARTRGRPVTKEQAERLRTSDLRSAIVSRFTTLIQNISTNQQFRDALRREIPDHFEKALDVLHEIQREVMRIEESGYSADYILYLFKGNTDAVHYSYDGDLRSIVERYYGNDLPKEIKTELKALSVLVDQYSAQDKL